MKNIHILLFLLLCLSNIINVYNSTLKKKSNRSSNKNNATDGFKKKSNIKIFPKRKGQGKVDPTRPGGGIEDGPVGPVIPITYPENLFFDQLKILIDTKELSESCPDDKREYLNNIVNAMKKAKEILEGFIMIGVDTNQDVSLTDVLGTYLEHEPDSQIFQDNIKLNDNYNYFIFAKFIGGGDGSGSLNTDTSSLIINRYSGIPYMGMVLLSNSIEDSKLTVDYLTPIMLHHFIRLLGFNSVNIPSPTLTIDDFEDVIVYAQKYFGCGDIDSITLISGNEGYYLDDDLIGVYWPKRLFLGELMTKLDYPEEQVLSEFTLTLLNSLPYLTVTKKYTGGLMRFGKHKGCYFFSESCDYYFGDISTLFANEFFLPYDVPSEIYPSCSSGRLSKTTYEITFEESSGRDKETHRLRRNQKKYERRLDISQVNDETCPIAQFNNEYYYGSCSDTNGPKNVGRNEVLGSNSFCVLSSLEESRNVKPKVLPLCYEMKCSSKSLSIEVGDYYIVCPIEGGKIFAEHFNGFIMCPDYNLICTGSTMCNNLLDCINKKSTEKEESLLNYNYNNNEYDDDDEIKTTQNPFKYSEVYRDYGWELANDGVCPKFCMQCKSHTDCERCKPKYVFLDGECVHVENCQSFGSDGYDVVVDNSEENHRRMEENENGDCLSCLPGNFLAEVSSGTYCVNNNNKDSYFLSNKALGIYKRCDLEILNCQKCSSETKCDTCSDGYELQENDGISICYKKEDDDDDGLSKGAIAGIVIGCVGCAAIISFIIILLLKRKKNEKDKISNSSKKIVETAKENVKDPLEDDIKVIEFDKKSENMDVTTKRIAPKDKNIY